jgi:hypothetical protein
MCPVYSVTHLPGSDHARPDRSSPPGVLLRDSFRESGKVKTRTLATPSGWPHTKVERSGLN